MKSWAGSVKEKSAKGRKHRPNIATPIVSSSPANLQSGMGTHPKTKGLPQEFIVKYYKKREITLYARLVSYLSAAGWPEEYSMQYFKEKYFLFYWLAVNLIFSRPSSSSFMAFPIPKRRSFSNFWTRFHLHIYHATTNDYTGVHMMIMIFCYLMKWLYWKMRIWALVLVNLLRLLQITLSCMS